VKIILADDDPISLLTLDQMLKGWGYEPLVTSDGLQAWEWLQQDDAPRMAILDWMMPGLDGVQICQKARETPETKGIYLILLTARRQRQDLLTGLASGANDYITKPFDRAELQVRLQVGVRVVELQQSLDERVTELQKALAHVKQPKALASLRSKTP
jgi:DNA-binding response OmpR family regulator